MNTLRQLADSPLAYSQFLDRLVVWMRKVRHEARELGQKQLK